MNPELTEAVKRAKDGDCTAFDDIYSLCNKTVYFTALSIVGNPADAEDIVQDVFVKVIRKLPSLNDEQAFPKWLNVITVNLSKNHLTKKKPELFESEEQEEQLLNEASLESDNPQPEQTLDKKETDRMIYELIDELPPDQRSAVMLFYYDEMSVDSIAQITGTNRNTVKSRLNYARKHLKKELELLAQKGTKLYSLPAVGTLLAALKMASGTPDSTAAEVPLESEAPPPAPKHSNAGRIAAGIAGAAAVGVGIAVSVNIIGTKPIDNISSDISSEISSDISESDSGARIRLGEEVPLDYNMISDTCGDVIIYYDGNYPLPENTDRGYSILGLDGQPVTDILFTSKFYDFTRDGHACLAYHDTYYVVDKHGKLYEHCIDMLDNGMRVECNFNNADLNELYSYNLYSGDNKSTIFTFDTEAVSNHAVYQPFDGTEYSYIGGYDGDFFDDSYLIAVDRSGNCTVVYQQNGIDLGIAEEESDMIMASNERVITASAYDRFVLMAVEGIEETEYVLYDIETYVGSYSNEPINGRIIYADADDGVIIVIDDTSDHGYSIYTTELDPVLTGQYHIEPTPLDGIYIVSDDLRSGYYNVKNNEWVYYDDLGNFTDGEFSFISQDGKNYFIDSEHNRISDDIPYSGYTVGDSLFYNDETKKLYRIIDNAQ